MQWVRYLSPLSHKIRQAMILHSERTLRKEGAKRMDLKKWLSIVQAISPLVLTAVNPALGMLSGLVVHAISQAEVEADKTTTGAQKKEAAIQIITDGINVVNGVKKTTVIDPAVVPTVSDVVDDVIEAANQLHDKPVSSSTK